MANRQPFGSVLLIDYLERDNVNVNRDATDSVNLSGADDTIAKQSSAKRCTKTRPVRGFGSTYCYPAIAWTAQSILCSRFAIVEYATLQIDTPRSKQKARELGREGWIARQDERYDAEANESRKKCQRAQLVETDSLLVRHESLHNSPAKQYT